MSLIELKNIQHSFGNKKIITDIDLVIEKGESLVILGESGTGKSVLLKIIIGLIKQDQGEVKINDNAKIGMLFQNNALFDSLKIWENITISLIHNNGLTNQSAKKIAEEILPSVGLPPSVAYLYPNELSGGMQRRVSLARTIIHKPHILLLDEPNTGLDPLISNTINEIIIEQSKVLGATTITVTHDIHSALKIAHKIAMVRQGSITWYGTTEEILNTDHEYVRKFFQPLSL